MFEDFHSFSVDHGGVVIRGRASADNTKPPLVLLHGYPQTHVMWHWVAPTLAKTFHVVAPDLRGYGASDKPDGGDAHRNYAKREMAADVIAVMRDFGHQRFAVCAHDRGARVAHRLAMDFPDAVSRLMLLDIAPTLAMYEQTSMEFARLYWHWFFLIQPAPFPEKLILANPKFFLNKKIGTGYAGLNAFTDETFAAYLANVSDPATVHSMCEDYRAAASIDLVHDREDRDGGRKIVCPTRVLWGQHGVIERCFKPLADWQKVATDVNGRTLPCGHYIAEEVPELLLAEIHDFFALNRA
jgi:haloacetate dehalogenase